MRSAAGVALVFLALASGCGGSDDRPDFAAPPPTTETTATSPTTSTDAASPATRAPVDAGAPVTRGQRDALTAQAAEVDAAVHRWDAALDSCLGPSGKGDDAGALCTRIAWEQLFDQMYVVQYELLAVMDRIEARACRGALRSALDGIHGFLSGATPLKVVWLDEQQQPPAVYDLEAIVDVARPAAAEMRRAVATSCKG